jgi:septal ring factor EnvC (AmiA/AmiB activator)
MAGTRKEIDFRISRKIPFELTRPLTLFLLATILFSIFFAASFRAYLDYRNQTSEKEAARQQAANIRDSLNSISERLTIISENTRANCIETSKNIDKLDKSVKSIEVEIQKLLADNAALHKEIAELKK